jgi:hypothetical protein
MNAIMVWISTQAEAESDAQVVRLDELPTTLKFGAVQVVIEPEWESSR